MLFARRCCYAIAVLFTMLTNGTNVACAQVLKGLSAVSVTALSSTRPGAIDTVTQSDAESRLRTAGIQVLHLNQQAPPKGAALLQIETVVDGSAVGIYVTLSEGALLLRDQIAWVTVWQRHRTFQAAQSSQDAITRPESDPYLGPSLKEFRSTGYMSPTVRQLMPQIIELELQAAKVNTPNLDKVGDYTKSFIDEFVSEWTAANAKSR